MLVMHALLCPELNSSEINYLGVTDQCLIGNTFAAGGEIGEIATPLFSEDLPITTAVSPEPFGLEGHVTTQNVRNCHIMGGQ